MGVTKPSATSKKKPPVFAKSAGRLSSNASAKFNQTSAGAFVLNETLQSLARGKKMKEALAVYNNPDYADVIDSHHAAIVVNACVRGGDIAAAETLIRSMEKEGDVSVQAYTTIMKGYAHNGDVQKCLSLLKKMCSPDRMRKRVLRPNVRTFNTFLRACLWSGGGGANGLLDEGWSVYETALKSKVREGQRQGQHRGRGEYEHMFDSSSYEYYINAACAALRVESALSKLKLLIDLAGWNDGLNQDISNPVCVVLQTDVSECTVSKESLLEFGETYVSSLLAVARAEAMLGRDKATILARANMALLYVSWLEKAAKDSKSGSRGVSVIVGGKRAYKHVAEDLIDSGQRSESNRLFRSHKVNELKQQLVQLTKRYEGGEDCAYLSKAQVQTLMCSRLFFFSGGGSTDHTKGNESITAADSKSETCKRLLHALGSFGLQEIVSATSNVQSKISASNPKTKSQTKATKRGHKRDLLKAKRQNKQCLNFLHAQFGDDGFIDMQTVFKPRAVATFHSPIHIELGAGAGDWITNQANVNKDIDYISVEMRADRVAQTFSSLCLNTTHDNKPLANLLVVGDECGDFLRRRVKHGTIQHIFANHPEPPTQNGGEGADSSHMLNDNTICAALKCLEGEGKGLFTIVSDNLMYARALCRSVCGLLERVHAHLNTNSCQLNDVKDSTKCEIGLFHSDDTVCRSGLRRGETIYGHSNEFYVDLMYGMPGEIVGSGPNPGDSERVHTHTVDVDKDANTSANVNMHKRMKTSFGSDGSSRVGGIMGTLDIGGNDRNHDNHGQTLNRKNKKSAERQARRNQRRLNKKQQL
eukprot:CFRG2658T1